MTRLERYKEKLKEFEHKRNNFMRQGRYDLMRRLDNDIADLRREIEEAERYEAKPIKQLMSSEEIEKHNLIPMLIEAHLAADFLTDCCYNIKDTLSKMGYNATTIVPELMEIKKRADSFACKLIGKNDKLNDLLALDDTLVAALHKKIFSYMKQRME